MSIIESLDVTKGDQTLVAAGPDGEIMTEAQHQVMHKKAIYCARPPDPSTEAAINFLNEGHDLTHFAGFHLQLPQLMDETLSMVLGEIEDMEGEPQESQVINYTEIAKRYAPMLREMVTSRSVDLFLTYIARLMASIFTFRPETLRSRAQVDVEYVLSHSSMAELTESLADDEVSRLAYLGMEKLSDTLRKKLGLVLFPNNIDLRYAVEVIEYRNLIVHNGGLVSRAYLKRQPRSSLKAGERAPGFSVSTLTTFLAHSVVDIDARAIAKFGLPVFNGDLPERMCHSMPHTPTRKPARRNGGCSGGR